MSLRQADVVVGWLRDVGRTDLEVLEVGCGSGWMCERMRPFGRVTGTDLADAVIDRARERVPDVRFVAGDFLELDLPAESADVVVGLEVIAHVPDQRAFVEAVRRVLRPGGHVMLATQNPTVLKRRAVDPQGVGQHRHWAGRRELRRLLDPAFSVRELRSVYPDGHRGVLRLVNSTKVNRLVSSVVPQARLDAAKERVGLGHTLMVHARKGDTA